MLIVTRPPIAFDRITGPDAAAACGISTTEPTIATAVFSHLTLVTGPNGAALCRTLAQETSINGIVWQLPANDPDLRSFTEAFIASKDGWGGPIPAASFIEELRLFTTSIGAQNPRVEALLGQMSDLFAQVFPEDGAAEASLINWEQSGQQSSQVFHADETGRWNLVFYLADTHGMRIPDHSHPTFDPRKLMGGDVDGYLSANGIAIYETPPCAMVLFRGYPDENPLWHRGPPRDGAAAVFMLR